MFALLLFLVLKILHIFTKNTHIFITVAEFQTHHNISHYFEESHRDIKSSSLHTIIKKQNQTEKKINDFHVVAQWASKFIQE